MNNSNLVGRRIVIVGNRGGTNIGGAFERAATFFEMNSLLLEPREAMRAPAWLRRFNWYLRGHRPTRLTAFSRRLVDSCLSHRAEILAVVGIAGVNASSLRKLAAAGVETINYLTDDPWNKAHYAPWFMKCLPEYTTVYSPRKSNMIDLRRAGCRDVRYLPFGYDPLLHFPEPPVVTEAAQYETDVVFVGGGDSDRVPYCVGLVRAGISLALYGDYWRRFQGTRNLFKGYADLATLRKATYAAKLCLCLGRRANRDGHAMRSFEVPAMGGCMLAEDTPEHREIFGEDGQAVVYFHSIPHLVERARWLVARAEERRRLAGAAHALITGGRNTYADRLRTMLEGD